MSGVRFQPGDIIRHWYSKGYHIVVEYGCEKDTNSAAIFTYLKLFCLTGNMFWRSRVDSKYLSDCELA